MKPVMCVRHRNGWCALKGELDPYARRDKTVCGYVVVLRWGSERRVPDCAECIAELQRQAPARGR